MSAQRQSSTRSAGNGKPTHRQMGGIEAKAKSFPLTKSYHVEPKPSRMSSAGKNTVIDGSELFATVDTLLVPEFNSKIYRFNPGLDLYPRLSKIALAYEKYTVRKLQVVFVPTRATTITPGSVYLAADFDPCEAPPGNISALSTYEVQSSTRLFDKCVLDIPPSRMHDGVRAKKMRCGPVAGDLSLYDACSIVVATFGCEDQIGIGQLWIHYELVLISPQVEPTRPVPVTISRGKFFSSYTLASGVPYVVPFQFDGVEPLDSPPAKKIVNGLGIQTVPDSLGSLIFPCGTFLVRCGMYTLVGSTLSSSTNIKILINGVIMEQATTSTSVLGGPTSISTAEYIGCELYLSFEEPTVLQVSLTMTGGTLLQTVPDGSFLTVQVV